MNDYQKQVQEIIDVIRQGQDLSRRNLGAVVDRNRKLRVTASIAPVTGVEQTLLRAEVVEHFSNAIARLNEARAHLALAHAASIKMCEELLATDLSLAGEVLKKLIEDQAN